MSRPQASVFLIIATLIAGAAILWVCGGCGTTAQVSGDIATGADLVKFQFAVKPRIVYLPTSTPAE